MPSSAERDRVIIDLALRQSGFVTAKQLGELGVSYRGVVGLQERGIIGRVLHGVYELRNAPSPNSMGDLIRRARAACLAGGVDALASHDTAARLWGIDIPAGDIIEITVAHARNPRPRRDGVIVHRARNLPVTARRQHEGVPTTSVEWTLMQLAGRYEPCRVGRALDDAIVRKLVTPRRMATLLDSQNVRVRPGVSTLRRELDLWLQGSGRPDSVPEASLLRALGRFGIPTPQCQYKVLDRDHLIAVLDFAWPAAKVGVEMDGWRYHATPSSHANDYLRADRLEECGWRLIRTTPSAFRAAPDPFLSRLHAVLQERGCV
jgi:hypothetical protein